MSGEVYTLGVWRAKPGRENDFVAAWHALGRHFTSARARGNGPVFSWERALLRAQHSTIGIAIRTADPGRIHDHSNAIHRGLRSRCVPSDLVRQEAHTSLSWRRRQTLQNNCFFVT